MSEAEIFKDIIIPSISTIFSFFALLLSIIASRKADKTIKKNTKLAEENTKLENASVELEIRNLIKEARKELESKISELRFYQEKEKNKTLTPDDKIKLDIVIDQCQNAKQEYINSYEEACSKYLDGKIDKERFKKTYVVELRNILDNKSLESFFSSPASPYKAILKVYDEWENHEK